MSANDLVLPYSMVLSGLALVLLAAFSEAGRPAQLAASLGSFWRVGTEHLTRTVNSARRLALVHLSWSQLSPCRGPAPKERCSLRNRWTACRFPLIRKLRAFKSQRLAWTSAATSSTITYSRLFVVALVHLARAVGVTNMLGLSSPVRV